MAQPKAARAVDVPPAMPEPDIAAELHALAASASSLATTPAAGADERRAPLVVIGHRGKGMNALAAEADPRLRGDVRENTLRSLNDAAASHPAVAYVEFDVQVTKDGCPVIFHDNFIYTEAEADLPIRQGGAAASATSRVDSNLPWSFSVAGVLKSEVEGELAAAACVLLFRG